MHRRVPPPRVSIVPTPPAAAVDRVPGHAGDFRHDTSLLERHDQHRQPPPRRAPYTSQVSANVNGAATRRCPRMSVSHCQSVTHRPHDRRQLDAQYHTAGGTVPLSSSRLHSVTRTDLTHPGSTIHVIQCRPQRSRRRQPGPLGDVQQLANVAAPWLQGLDGRVRRPVRRHPDGVCLDRGRQRRAGAGSRPAVHARATSRPPATASTWRSAATASSRSATTARPTYTRDGEFQTQQHTATW